MQSDKLDQEKTLTSNTLAVLELAVNCIVTQIEANRKSGRKKISMKGVRTAYTERELSLTEIEDALKVATKLSDVSAFEVAIRDLFKDGNVDNWKEEVVTQYGTDKKPPAPKKDKAEVNAMRLSGFAVY